MAAVTQVGHDTPGRVYYLRKQAEGKTRKEAMRALEATHQRRRLPTPHRRHPQLTIATARASTHDRQVGSGGQCEDVTNPA